MSLRLWLCSRHVSRGEWRSVEAWLLVKAFVLFGIRFRFFVNVDIDCHAMGELISTYTKTKTKKSANRRFLKFITLPVISQHLSRSYR